MRCNCNPLTILLHVWIAVVQRTEPLRNLTSLSGEFRTATTLDQHGVIVQNAFTVMQTVVVARILLTSIPPIADTAFALWNFILHKTLSIIAVVRRTDCGLASSTTKIFRTSTRLFTGTAERAPSVVQTESITFVAITPLALEFSMALAHWSTVSTHNTFPMNAKIVTDRNLTKCTLVFG